MVKAFIIECRTGCSCCAYENHYRGPYSSREVADAVAKRFYDNKLLASQYARNGVYDVQEYDAEILPDGRIIIDNTVFANFMDDGIEDDYIASNWD
jgi:hypothetical protein